MFPIELSAKEIKQRLDTAISERWPILNKQAVFEALEHHFWLLGFEPLPVRWAPNGVQAWGVAEKALSSGKKIHWRYFAKIDSFCPLEWWFSKQPSRPLIEVLAFQETAHVVERKFSRDDVNHIKLQFYFALATGAFVLFQAPVRMLFWPMVLAYEAGLFAYYVMQDEIIAVPRPVQPELYHPGLMNSNSPVIEWPGPQGTSFWMYKGLLMDGQALFKPETLSVHEILRERNVEIRRVMIERYGAERFIEQGYGKLLDASDYGKLYQLYLSSGEPWTMVEVACPSTGRAYMLRVPPTMRTARGAVAWTFDVRTRNYHPVQET